MRYVIYYINSFKLREIEFCMGIKSEPEKTENHILLEETLINVATDMGEDYRVYPVTVKMEGRKFLNYDIRKGIFRRPVLRAYFLHGFCDEMGEFTDLYVSVKKGKIGVEKLLEKLRTKVPSKMDIDIGDYKTDKRRGFHPIHHALPSGL